MTTRGCEQELCENWTGDGNVCACDLFDLTPSNRCPDCDSTMAHSLWDGWSCGVCGWMENPL